VPLTCSSRRIQLLRTTVARARNHSSGRSATDKRAQAILDRHSLGPEIAQPSLAPRVHCRARITVLRREATVQGTDEPALLRSRWALICGSGDVAGAPEGANVLAPEPEVLQRETVLGQPLSDDNCRNAARAKNGCYRRIMSENEAASSGTPLMAKGRMEAFSDGVIAIAITLLVLDVAIRPPGSPTEQFLRGWPSYLAYLVSFLTIGAAWIGHHALTNRLNGVDSLFLRLNLLFLLVVAFLPFPTRLVAEALDRTTTWQRMAAVVYGVTLLVISLLGSALTRYSRQEHLREPGPDEPDAVEAHKKFRYVVAAYVVTILLALVVPKMTIIFYFAIAIVLVVPFRSSAREVFKGRRS